MRLMDLRSHHGQVSTKPFTTIYDYFRWNLIGKYKLVGCSYKICLDRSGFPSTRQTVFPGPQEEILNGQVLQEHRLKFQCEKNDQMRLYKS